MYFRWVSLFGTRCISGISQFLNCHNKYNKFYKFLLFLVIWSKFLFLDLHISSVVNPRLSVELIKFTSVGSLLSIAANMLNNAHLILVAGGRPCIDRRQNWPSVIPFGNDAHVPNLV